MEAFGIILVILVVLVLIFGIAALSMYNGFVKARNLIQESWRQIDVELNRRYELIPNLVETVRAVAAHERNTLEDITRLRNQAASMAHQGESMPSQQRADIEGQLSGAVRNLMVSVEAYPQLRSNVNFLELQKQLTETEDRIAAGRRFYNANVRNYNTKVESVPSNIIANMFKFEKATYFEVRDQAVRQAPGVNFGELAYRPGETTSDQPAALPQQQSTGGFPQPGVQQPGQPVQQPQYADPQYSEQPNPQQQYGQQQYGQQQYGQQQYGQGYQPPQQ
ncbi:LemA family protein [Enemella sp. A6]|uniref:LemA family protein n=1 Tax=Enemella sp. A6 TaxID=3440152 RepID=UPI003EBC5E4A